MIPLATRTGSTARACLTTILVLLAIPVGLYLWLLHEAARGLAVYDGGWFTTAKYAPSAPLTASGVWVNGWGLEGATMKLTLGGARSPELSTTKTLPADYDGLLLPGPLSGQSALTVHLTFPPDSEDRDHPHRTTHFTGVYLLTQPAGPETLLAVRSMGHDEVWVRGFGPVEQRRGVPNRRWTNLGGVLFGITVESTTSSSRLENVTVSYPGGGYQIGDLDPGDVHYYGTRDCYRLRDKHQEPTVRYTVNGQTEERPVRLDMGPPHPTIGRMSPLFEARIPW